MGIFFCLAKRLTMGLLLCVFFSVVPMTMGDDNGRHGYSFGRIFSSSHTFSLFFRYVVCLFEFVRYYPSGDGIGSYPSAFDMKQKHLCCFPYVCVCPPPPRKNDGKKESERERNKTLEKWRVTLQAQAYEGQVALTVVEKQKKETEKGDFDRSEFVQGFYFLQIRIIHRLVTFILFNKNAFFFYVLFVRNKICVSRCSFSFTTV